MIPIEVEQLTLLSAALVVLFGFHKKWWVWGWHYEQKVTECDQWKQIALERLEFANRLADQILRVQILGPGHELPTTRYRDEHWYRPRDHTSSKEKP